MTKLHLTMLCSILQSHSSPLEVMIGFDLTNYTIMENGGGVDVCAELKGDHSECLVAFPFEVQIETYDDTAGIVSCVTI